MKNMYKHLGILAMASVLANDSLQSIVPKDIDITPKEIPIPKGCEKFVFNGSFGKYETVAINYKSAKRKYQKWWDEQYTKNQIIPK